ncbi:9406_t:CDS:2, partial [Acaulospora colombiana]
IVALAAFIASIISLNSKLYRMEMVYVSLTRLVASGFILNATYEHMGSTRIRNVATCWKDDKFGRTPPASSSSLPTRRYNFELWIGLSSLI